MMVKFLAHGTGSVAAAYLLREGHHEKDPDPDQAPEEITVLRGNPGQVTAVADALAFEHRYTSGLFAWAPEDAPSDRQISRVLDEFEKTAWAGLKPDRYTWAAVQHRKGAKLFIQAESARGAGLVPRARGAAAPRSAPVSGGLDPIRSGDRRAPGLWGAGFGREDRCRGFPIRVEWVGCVVELVVNLGRNDDVLSERRGRGNGLLVFKDTFDVQLDCLVHPSFGFFLSVASCDTARQVRRVRGEVLASVLDHDEEAMHHNSLSPACFRMLLYVPGAKSSDSRPAIVTRPVFIGCLN